MKKIELKLLKHTPFVEEDNTFNFARAIDYKENVAIWDGKKDYFQHLNVSMYFKNMPLFLKILLNNEKSVIMNEKNNFDLSKENISDIEYQLFEKWREIFFDEIKQIDAEFSINGNIDALAKQNAAYMVSVFAPTDIIYTSSLSHLNKNIVALQQLLKKEEKNELEKKLSPYVHDLLGCFEQAKLINKELSNVNHEFLLFAKEEKREHFNATYVTKYLGSFAQLAEAQKDSFLNYEINFNDNHYFLPDEEKNQFYIPPLIVEKEDLKKEWQKDLEKVSNYIPQGQLVEIIESGTLEQFLMKIENTMCISSQLELFNQVKETLKNYQYQLSLRDQFLMKILFENEFPCRISDNICQEKCDLEKEKILSRKI